MVVRDPLRGAHRLPTHDDVETAQRVDHREAGAEEEDERTRVAPRTDGPPVAPIGLVIKRLIHPRFDVATRDAQPFEDKGAVPHAVTNEHQLVPNAVSHAAAGASRERRRPRLAALAAALAAALRVVVQKGSGGVGGDAPGRGRLEKHHNAPVLERHAEHLHERHVDR